VEALQLSSRRVGDAVVVAAVGDLDTVTSPRLDSCMSDALRTTACVVLDLSAVDFMDTSSLAVIVGYWKKLMARGGMLALAAARYQYTRTLWITGLADRLPMFDTVAEAVTACTAEAAAVAGQPGQPGQPAGEQQQGGPA
jgi:anti-sigma B factor antagonist